MRLITLEFSGIGPFAGHHTIDFSRFDASGLFLMRGATGAGKSTIIDALTFALYGTVAGGRATSSLDRMRSDYADPKTQSIVRLLFEVNSGVYEVVRTPSYLKEGNKNPTPATAVLEKVTFDDETEVSRHTISSRIREVNAEVTRIVGIGEDQFLQTVVLPQGKFAEFIRSAPTERKTVLQEIFRTDSFEIFTDKLRSRARQALAEYEHQLTVTEHAGMLLSTDIADLCAQRRFDDAQAVARELEEARNREGEIRAREFDAARANHREIHQTLAENRSVIEAQQRWHVLREEQSKLDGEREHIDRQRERLTKARDAHAVSLAISALTHAQEECAKREDEYRLAVDELREDRRYLEFDDAPEHVLNSEKISAHIDELSGSIADLVRATEVERSLATHRRQATKLAESIAELVNKREPLAATIEQAPAALEQVKKQMTELRGRLTGLETSREQVRDLDARLAKLDEADELRQKLVNVADDIGLARKEEVRCQRALDALEQRWRANYAATLAQHLEEGIACPVCGGIEHPKPARKDVDQVSDEALAGARAALANANTEKGKLLAQQATTTARITELNRLVGADRGTLELTREEAGTVLTALEADEKQLQTLHALYEQAQEELNDDRAVFNELELDLTTQRSQHASLEKLIADEDRTVTLARGDAESVEARLLTNEKTRERLRILLQTVDALEGARATLASAKVHVSTALDESQFSSVKHARAASLPRGEMDNLDRAITDFERRYTRLLTRLDDLDKTGLYLRVAANPDSLAATASRISERYNRAQDAVISHREALKQLRKEIAQLTASIAALDAIEEKSGPIRRLAELASGAAIEDGHRVPLSTWVLMTRFEDVLAASNPYLTQFSSGRYALRRVSIDLGSSQHIAGLGLAVYDFETDSLRPPKSLSGGETFYASLALALGLVEVVSSEAGGIEFQTMLIDEGFGHLDQSTLDQVMQGLEHLRNTGRTVGIVSHVEEMRRRINDGIIVTKLPEGGSTLSVVG